MERLFDILLKVSKILGYIGGAALTFMMFLTVADVLLLPGTPVIFSSGAFCFSFLSWLCGFLPFFTNERGAYGRT